MRAAVGKGQIERYRIVSRAFERELGVRRTPKAVGNWWRGRGIKNGLEWKVKGGL